MMHQIYMILSRIDKCFSFGLVKQLNGVSAADLIAEISPTLKLIDWVENRVSNWNLFAIN